jgi:hypothetical protein
MKYFVHLNYVYEIFNIILVTYVYIQQLFSVLIYYFNTAVAEILPFYNGKFKEMY